MTPPQTNDVAYTLEIRDLHANAGDTQILNGINLTVRSGEVHAVMGPNGAGKSTLSAVIMGKPGYTVTEGSIMLNGSDIVAMPTWQRALAGLHLVMQYPTEIPGVGIDELLSEALTERGLDPAKLTARIAGEATRIGLDEALIHRAVNVDFSGGEKKRNEIMQMAILEPELAILDETDSGLDIDALRIVAQGIREVRKERPKMGIVLITHYQRLLDELQPDFVHILIDGRIVKSGGMEIAEELEKSGYESYKE